MLLLTHVSVLCDIIIRGNTENMKTLIIKTPECRKRPLSLQFPDTLMEKGKVLRVHIKVV
jgi:hypothetical protein